MKQILLQSVWMMILAAAAGSQRGCEFTPVPTGADPNSTQASVTPDHTVPAEPAKEATEPQQETAMETKPTQDDTLKDIPQTERQWAERLTPQQYKILRKKNTERPYTGKYLDHHEQGVYICAGCGNKLFVSDTKFDSHCGWPAFSAPKDGDAVTESLDTSHGMIRTEITCSRCGSHLGHVFNDGPAPTGQRYCINSLALDFKEEDTAKTTKPETPPAEPKK